MTPRPLACLLAFLVAVLWLLVALPPEVRGGLMAYSGDELHFSSMARTVADGQAEYRHPRLAAPDGGDWRDYPIAMPLEFQGVRWLSRLGFDSHAAFFWTWVIVVGITAATASLGFLEVGFTAALAAALGVLFALQPFTWQRQLFHFNLVFPLVALVAAASLRLAAGGWAGRVPRWIALACFLQGISFVYYSYFGLLVLLAGTAAGCLRAGWRVAGQALFCILPLLLGICVYALPVLSFRAEQGHLSLHRSAGESDLSGLKLRHLLSPREQHPLALWRGLEARLHGQNFPGGDGETYGTRLGTAGSLGLILALGMVVAAASGRQAAWAETLALPAALLAGFSLLLGLTGGLGTVINALTIPDFRIYARIIIYLQFYALTVVGVVLTVLGGRLRPLQVALAMVLLVVAGLADQTWVVPVDADARRQLPMDRDFVGLLEAELPPGAAVFQMPVTPFPIDAPPTGRMRFLDAARPYAHSRHLRWSFAAQSGRQDGWARWVEGVPPGELKRALQSRGFRALWLDADGFTARPDDLARLLGVLGQPTWSSPTCRYLVYDLMRPRVAPVATPALTAEEMARIEWRVQELPAAWSGPQQVKVRLRNRTERTLASNPPQPVHLGYHWVDPQGRPVVWDGSRTLLPPVAPGAALDTWMTVAPPPGQGPFTLQLRLVQEGVRWQESGPDAKVGGR